MNMIKPCHNCVIVIIVAMFLLFNGSEQLKSSQSRSLLRIKRLLYFPTVLRPWKNNTDFCDSEPTQSLTIVCYDETITQLHIIGPKDSPLLPKNFSLDSFFRALTKFPDLKVLTLVSLGIWGPLPSNISRLSSLEILNMSSNFLYGEMPKEITLLTSLRTLILDDNMLAGSIPSSLSSLSLLTFLSLKKNSFNGTLPNSLGYVENLRVIALSQNHIYGEVPDLTRLTNLQVLELEHNAFGPKFPQIGNKLVTLVLSKNRFRSGIPTAKLETFYQLKKFDLSFNSFVGPFPQSLLTLPSIAHINVAANKFTGMFFSNETCNPGLEFVDLSSNLFTGNVPDSLLSSSNKDRVVLYSKNCLSTQKQNQYPSQFCHTEALAVGIKPEIKKQNQVSKAVLASGIIGGVLGSAAIATLIFIVYKRLKSKVDSKSATRSITENTSTGIGYTAKLICDARYISQTTKTGALGLPNYRVFSLEELEEATNNFDTSAFMGESSHGQMYRGLLKDGTYVAIRCLKMKRRFGTQNFMHHIELISKRRHRNLVSALGHCFECYLDDSTVSRVFLVFEYVPNGTLRNWISEGHSKRTLSWSRRISAAIGIAKGIQFLHTGIVPGVYRNSLKITDILLDYSFIAKISSYNLPLLSNKTVKVGHGVSSSEFRDPSANERLKHEEKIDVYDFGVILLEIIKGIPVKSEKQADALIDQIQVAVVGDRVGRRGTVDPTVNRTCLDQSLKTMMEICLRCLHKNPDERPSFEDVLWNLQYAAQVQDAWRGGESLSSEGSSPI